MMRTQFARKAVAARRRREVASEYFKQLHQFSGPGEREIFLDDTSPLASTVATLSSAELLHGLYIGVAGTVL